MSTTGPSISGTLLVPYNGSHCADAAYTLAVQLSSDLRAPMSLLHVRDKPKPLSWDWASSEVRTLAERFVQVQRDLGEALKSHLEDLAGLAKEKGVQVSLTVEEGPVLESIVRASLHPDVSAVVVGAHELSDIARAMAGDTALQLVRTADKPVLTVRSPNLVRPFRNVLFAASGFDVVDLRAAKFAAAVAMRVGAPLRVLHLAEDRADYAQIDRLAAACRDAYPELSVELDEVDDWVAEPASRDRSIARAIAEYSRTMQADLIVVGTAHRSGMARIVEGSIAEHLVGAADCAVAVVPGYQST